MSTSPKRRVAVVYQHLPHYRGPVFRCMSESPGIEYHFLAAPQGENGIHTVPFGELTHTHALVNHWLGPFLVQRGLFSALRRVRPHDVIFLGDYRYLTTWINAAFQRTIGTRVYFWTQGWRRIETGSKAVVRNRFYRIADHLFVYGNRSRELGIAAGFEPHSITAIGNSERSEADLQELSTTRRAAPELRIGAVMRLSPNKKAAQLAGIASELIARGIPTRVHIAGKGVGAGPLEEACAAAGVPLRQYGSIHSEDDLADFYSELDVCVIPGAAGLSVLQALSHGRPVVTNDTLDTQGPEVEALIPGVTGSLVPEDNIGAFAHAVSDWQERLRTDGESVAMACRDSVMQGWVAERQAELIARTVADANGTVTKVAVINPNASGDSYSGPNIFMDRLFANNERVSSTIVTGCRDATEAFPWAEVAVPAEYDRSGRGAQARWMLSLAWWLWRNSRRFDVVHAHGVYLFNLLPLFAAQLRRVPVVLVPLGEDAELRFTRDHRRQPLARMRRKIVARASLGLGLSRRTQEELIKAGLPSARVGPIGNPVDTELFCPPPTDNRFNQATVGFIGVLGDRKGAHVVLEALSMVRVNPDMSHVRAIFVGPFYNETYKHKFTASVTKLGLTGQVDVTGYTKSVADQVHQMSMMVLPSNQEGLPGALVEAMASGLPAVVTDVGAMGDAVVDADAGYVVERDPTAIARAIESILHDKDTWSSMSKNARDYALNEYSISSVQSQYQSAISSISRSQS